MGVEKEVEFHGITIPRVYGTISHTFFRIKKNLTDDTFECSYQVLWYIIQQFEEQDCITTAFDTSSASFTIEVLDLEDNLYTLAYNHLKSNDITAVDYLDPIPFRSELESA